MKKIFTALLIFLSLQLIALGQTTRKLPYPIIFVHGLSSDGTTWNQLTAEFDTYYQWQFGGQMDFCLNFDGDTRTARMATDYKNFDSPIIEGDYYFVNFATDRNGRAYKGADNLTLTLQSNQSAIVKQGIAIRDAIKKVLAINKVDKVVLVGHSMGGLAARQYLQNENYFQNDGKHHVAKLYTIGTPHGGSNAASALLLQFVNNTDERSEAVRDLRYPQGTAFVGRYLFGGAESANTLYVNDDVNCDGTVNGTITGLNQKALPTDVAYICTIGVGSLLGGDGVVATERQNLNTYFNIQADTLMDRVNNPSTLGVQHTILHTRFANNIKGLDEPNYFENAYGIEIGKTYQGTITQQPQNFTYKWDFDDFKFTILRGGKYRFRLNNIQRTDFEFDVVNARYDKINRTTVSGGRTQIDTIISISTPGIYYLEIAANPTQSNWLSPYTFRIDEVATPTSDINPVSFQVYPNPANSEITVKLSKEITPSVSMLTLTNMVGQTVIKTSITDNTAIDVSQLPSGMYLVTLQKDGKVLESKKIMVAKP